MDSFKTFYEQCNVCANELQVGDAVENINPECDHYRSKGIVLKIKKIPQDEEKTAGNIIVYKVCNSCKDFDPAEVNGEFEPGDDLEKTEIQLKKIINEITMPEFLKPRYQVTAPPGASDTQLQYIKDYNKWLRRAQYYGDEITDEHPGKKPDLRDYYKNIMPPQRIPGITIPKNK